MSLLEKLAALEHEQWAGWMKYLFEKASPIPEAIGGGVHIMREEHERWKRQIDTSYEDLSEKEKESDRIEARKVLAIVKAESADLYTGLLHNKAMEILKILRDITPEGQALRDVYPDIEIDNEECTAPLEVALREWEAAGFPFVEEWCETCDGKGVVIDKKGELEVCPHCDCGEEPEEENDMGITVRDLLPVLAKLVREGKSHYYIVTDHEWDVGIRHVIETRTDVSDGYGILILDQEDFPKSWQRDVDDNQRVADALAHLRDARDLLKKAKCPRATDKVRSAIRSAEGAQRNMVSRHYREQE